MFTVEAKGALNLTAMALSGLERRLLGSLPAPLGQAMRVALEDGFQLKVRRATEPQDMLALVLAKEGLNRTRVTSPVPGDCMTLDQYLASPAASAPVEERMKAAATRRICGTTSVDRGSVSATFAQLALHMSTCCMLDSVVIDRTGIAGPVNFEMTLAPGGTIEERFARAVVPLGVRLERVKAPAEYLVIESVQKLR